MRKIPFLNRYARNSGIKEGIDSFPQVLEGPIGKGSDMSRPLGIPWAENEEERKEQEIPYPLKACPYELVQILFVSCKMEIPDLVSKGGNHSRHILESYR